MALMADAGWSVVARAVHGSESTMGRNNRLQLRYGVGMLEEASYTAHDAGSAIGSWSTMGHMLW